MQNQCTHKLSSANLYSFKIVRVQLHRNNILWTIHEFLSSLSLYVHKSTKSLLGNKKQKQVLKREGLPHLPILKPTFSICKKTLCES